MKWPPEIFLNSMLLFNGPDVQIIVKWYNTLTFVCPFVFLSESLSIDLEYLESFLVSI